MITDICCDICMLYLAGTALAGCAQALCKVRHLHSVVHGTEEFHIDTTCVTLNAVWEANCIRRRLVRTCLVDEVMVTRRVCLVCTLLSGCCQYSIASPKLSHSNMCIG